MNQLPRHGGCCSSKEMFFEPGTLCKHTFLVCLSVLIPPITQIVDLYLNCITIYENEHFRKTVFCWVGSNSKLVQLLVWRETLGLLLQSLGVFFPFPCDTVTSSCLSGSFVLLSQWLCKEEICKWGSVPISIRVWLEYSRMKWKWNRKVQLRKN